MKQSTWQCLNGDLGAESESGEVEDVKLLKAEHGFTYFQPISTVLYCYLFYLFFIFILGPHLGVLRTFFWFCAKELILVVLEGLYGMPGIELVPFMQGKRTTCCFVSLALDCTLFESLSPSQIFSCWWDQPSFVWLLQSLNVSLLFSLIELLLWLSTLYPAVHSGVWIWRWQQRESSALQTCWVLSTPAESVEGSSQAEFTTSLWPIRVRAWVHLHEDCSLLYYADKGGFQELEFWISHTSVLIASSPRSC